MLPAASLLTTTNYFGEGSADGSGRPVHGDRVSVFAHGKLHLYVRRDEGPHDGPVWEYLGELPASEVCGQI
jgi:hypothetical protein